MKPRPIFLVILVLILTVLAGVFIYPDTFDKYYKFANWKLGLDLVGGSHLVYEVELSGIASADQDSVVNGLRDVIEKRVNLFGVSEPQVYTSKVGAIHRLVVELAGIKDVRSAIEQIGATPFLYFAIPQTLQGETEKGEIKQVIGYQQTALTGRYISSAKLDFNSTTGAPQISLVFNDEGAKIFETLTEQHVGKPLAIFLDGQLIEEPIVQEKISGGRAQITGRFTVKEAKQLVERFNAGALPAPIKLINQQTIGASLGKDSLRKTIWAGLIGTLVVMAFMTLYYRGLGLVAALALLIYSLLALAIFKLFGVTMTLAGIAGFILSIGMAVDANILAFERRKEELRKGLSKALAMEEGFRRAWPSIRDSNITTIITALVLYYMTTGFVRGFALTLLIGVVISMFSAITVSRALLRTFLRKNV